MSAATAARTSRRSTSASWLSRILLADLERRAVEAGRRRLVLETGIRQPEAIGLYSSSGYTEIPRFGVYRCDPRSRCFGKLLPMAVQPVP